MSFPSFLFQEKRRLYGGFFPRRIKSFAEFAAGRQRTDQIVFHGVGALRKHAGGMFLASDLGGYAAVASIWISTALSRITDSHTSDVGHWFGMIGMERTTDYRENVVGRAPCGPPHDTRRTIGGGAHGPRPTEQHRTLASPFGRGGRAQRGRKGSTR